MDVILFSFNPEITRSKGDAPPAHYTLKINSFSQLSKMVRETREGKYESSGFDVGGYKWYINLVSPLNYISSELIFEKLSKCFSSLYDRKLLLYPNGNAKRNGNDHISLYLALADTGIISDGSQIDVRLKFFVYDQIQDKYLTIQGGWVAIFFYY